MPASTIRAESRTDHRVRIADRGNDQPERASAPYCRQIRGFQPFKQVGYVLQLHVLAAFTCLPGQAANLSQRSARPLPRHFVKVARIGRHCNAISTFSAEQAASNRRPRRQEPQPLPEGPGGLGPPPISPSLSALQGACNVVVLADGTRPIIH